MGLYGYNMLINIYIFVYFLWFVSEIYDELYWYMYLEIFILWFVIYKYIGFLVLIV